MKTAEDIESYLIRLETGFEQVADDLWVVSEGGQTIVVSINGPVVVFRCKVLEAARLPPVGQREPIYQRLLELNASDMLHGAYGIEEGDIVVAAALELENLDYNEFQAVLEDIGLAVTKHYPVLNQLAA